MKVKTCSVCTSCANCRLLQKCDDPIDMPKQNLSERRKNKMTKFNTSKDVERLMLIAATECLDPKCIYPEDFDILEAMAYAELYGDQGGQVADKVNIDRYLAFLCRAQEEVDDLPF